MDTNKIPEQVNDSTLFDDFDKERNDFIIHSSAIADRITSIMLDKNIDNKQLADLLNFTEEDIEIILCGFYDFTLQIISKIERALETKLILHY